MMHQLISRFGRRRLLLVLGCLWLGGAMGWGILPVLGDRPRSNDEGLRLSLLRMREGKLTGTGWADLATALGDDRYRDPIRRGVLDLRPSPRADLVALLEHPLLTVRLGALELLEELAGEDFGFDPWRASADARRESLAKWLAWSAPTNAAGASNLPATARSAGLAPEEVERYLLDALSEDLDRAGRARRMLARGGALALAAVRAYGAAHPELSPGAQQRLRELRYGLQLAPVPGWDAPSLAHRLLFGNLDGRLRAVRDAANGRQPAVPVIRDFLADPDPLMRETAIDALAAAGGRKVVAIFDEHLQREADVNVAYAALRQLGNLRSKRALDLAVRYLAHTNEDLVVVALESLAKMRSDAGTGAVARCLADPRWRVRVAALKTAETLQFSSLAPRVVECLDDADDFVRGAAVGALARLGARAALPRLEALFNREDNLKGPIIRCLYEADQAIPTHWLARLDAAAPSVWLSVLDQIEMADEKLAPLLAAGAAHRDADVATTALRKIGPMAQENSRLAKALAAQMQSGERRRQLAVMTTLALPANLLAAHQPEVLRARLDQAAPAPQTPSRTRTPSKEIEDLFAAFEGAPAAAPAGPKTASGAEDIFQAFESGGGGVSEEPVETFLRVGRACLARTDDAELASAAARMLVHLGEASAIPRVLADLPALPEDQRLRLARSLGRVRTVAALPLIEKLLADPVAEVRQAACEGVAAEGADESCLRLILSALTRPGSVLTPADANPGLGMLVRRPDLRPALARGCRSLLETNRTDSLRTFGLILLGRLGASEIETDLGPFFTSPSPWQRRAAYHALAKVNPARLRQEITKIAAAASDDVREVVPHALRPQHFHLPWTDYLDERTELVDFGYFGASEDESFTLSPEALAALQRLGQDRSERVRFQALFCLIGHRQPVDLGEVARLLEQLPRDSMLRGQFSSYVLEQHTSLGREFALLVPHLEFRYQPEEQLQRMREHFAIREDADPPEEVAPAAPPRTTLASYAPVPPRTSLPAPVPENYQLVYFTKPGCKECAAVTKLLTQLKEAFPHLRVLEQDINKTAAAQLNEALCARFQVPVAIRLVAPAVFCGGYLIKDDVTLTRLGQMLERAGGVPAAQWLAIPQADLTQAHRQIATRYERASRGLVLFAGLLDGINPCAFATIVFLLSYLQVTRKSPSQTRQIALAYIAGVFLAYFLIGFGLTQVAVLVSRLRWAGALVTYLMAGFALLVMCLSLRDGWLALQGRATDMTLQLPAPLKGRIHGLIRQSMRQAHFVLVAFFLGAAISFLELACTGQVYLPTITYMVQQGERRATWDLLLYNLAFIAPLTALFLLHQYGLRSGRLLALFQRRVAWIRFATALLFLFLAVFLVFGR